MNFPKPRKIGPRAARWNQHELDCYDAAVAGQAPPAPPAAPRWLRDTEVAERYSVSRVTPWRWAASEERAG
ncbi:MAG: hypothetical protein AB7I01_01870 [Gammaproteobacteria bacterium]